MLQVLFDQSHISHFDKKIVELEDSFIDGHPVSQKLFAEKMQALKMNSANQNEIAPMRRRTFLSVRYFPVNKAKGSLKILVSVRRRHFMTT